MQGSGWGWLAAKKETGKLFVITAPNQDTVQHVAPVRISSSCTGHGARLSECHAYLLLPVYGLSVVLLALLLWLGWPCAAPPPPLLGVLRPIPFRVGVICASFPMHGLVPTPQLANL